MKVTRQTLGPELRRIVRFGLVGLIPFATDFGVYFVLATLLGVPPLVARGLSIFLAGLVSWWGHRTITFRVATPPTWPEFGRYWLLASGNVAVNYMVFTALVFLVPAWRTGLAVIISSAAAMVVSYFGLNWGVFRAKQVKDQLRDSA